MSSKTLYRRYRPTKFADIVGQDHIVKPLQTALERDAVAHAYLFHGPRGTGKTTTARVFAGRLNCLKPKQGEPCGKCKNCLAALGRRSLDIIEIDAASHRGIDDIRALQEGLNLSPGISTYKIYIIDEVHMLTKEAFTALLKTLEEPVAHVIFILATTEFHKVPETVISRCQVYRFRRASAAELSSRLQSILDREKKDLGSPVLEFIIRRSDGCFRDAESLLGQILNLAPENSDLETITEALGLPSNELLDEFLTSLVRGESHGAVKAIDKAFALGFDPEQFISEAIRLARDGAIGLITGQKIPEKFAREENAAQRLPGIVRALVQAIQDLTFVPEPLIAIHLAILTLTSQKGESPSAPKVLPKASPRTEPSQAKEISQEKSNKATNEIAISQVKATWPKLIEHTKGDNAVASTFLRAMEPQGVDGSTIIVQASYALHRNFFDKPKNKELLEQGLSEMVGTRVSVRVAFKEEAPAVVTVNQNSDPREAEQLISAVKDVFGEAKV